jgi:anaerobic selenocysteine-containing dehydrogenase/Fe-S-cluster-containing dehydrogenase component
MPELDRRDFLKLVGVGAGAAAAAGCSDPVEKLIPYVIQPEVITPGIPVYYASTCRECSAGCGLHVKTREGRPIKLEGNPNHPVNKGSLCARGQAGIGRTYHPDRFPGPMLRGSDGRLAPISWKDATELLATKLRGGAGSAYLLGSDPGPTASGLLDKWVAAAGAGGRIVYEPFAPEALLEAAQLVFGAAFEPVFDLSKSDLVVSFANDFLETWVSPIEHARQLAEARDIGAHPEGGARFVYFGPRLSMTASSSDEWIPARPGSEGILAMALARVVLENGAGSASERALLQGVLDGFDPERAAARTGVDAKTIERVGKALAKAKAPVALPPAGGFASNRARAATAAVLVLNQLTGAVGKTLALLPLPSDGKRTSYKELLALVDAMKSGKVSVLLVHGADPSYSMPKTTGFAEALPKVPFLVSFASSKNETTALAHLILPEHTPLESWGDAQPRAGVRSLVQPTLRPLQDTQALVDALFDVGRAIGPEVAAKLSTGSFRTLLEAAWSDVDFRQALQRGGAFSEKSGAASASLAPAVAKLEVAEPLLEGEGDYVLLALASPLLYDGRGANLPWLQEIPDPVMKIVWQSWAEVSHETAQKLGVVAGDVVVIETAGQRRAEVPVVPRGGLRNDVVALAVGQGHTQGLYASHENDGRPGEARGVNVISLLAAATDEAGGRAWLTTKAKLSKAGHSERVAFTGANDNLRERMLGEAIALTDLVAGKSVVDPEMLGLAASVKERLQDAARKGETAAPPAGVPPEALGRNGEFVAYDPTEDAKPGSPYRWGMSIDLDRCTGCSACVAACYLENNIPIVGEEQSIRSRIMSWLRIERYVTDGDIDFVGGRPPHSDLEHLGRVDVRHSPMMCQHCGSAPCEPVCPVFATYHNPEGLNGMVYNRCIGTRYCSNNCPYKVRRFNYYDYSLENWPESMKLMLNPDVTVRCQGVMEKCTYCTQRVEAARQPAKNEKRLIRDGEVTPACAQSCPTQAITFGNLKDADSQVAKKGSDPKRGYHALHVLNTRPATTYLAKVVRGPVEV